MVTMISVKYCGPYADHTGYGEANRNAIMALVTAGCDVVTEKVSFTQKKGEYGVTYHMAEDLSSKKSPCKIKILHVTPDLYKNHIEKGKYHIGHLFWETDKLPAKWVPSCNLMDEIWTGAPSTAQAIKDSGVRQPIFVFPQAINTKVTEARPFKFTKDQADKFIFYSIFEWKERKNPRALLTSFWKEFKDDKDVVLLIKTSLGDYTEEEKQKILNDAKLWKATMGYSSYPDVYLCIKLLNREEMTRIHSTGHCFVSAHRGEGWGIPQVEASILGNPVISTRIGGVHEFWKGKHFRFVEYEMVPIDQTYDRYYEVGQNWAEVSEEHLRHRMRKMYETWKQPKGKQLLKLIGSQGKSFSQTNFSYEKVGRDMALRLEIIERSIP